MSIINATSYANASNLDFTKAVFTDFVNYDFASLINNADLQKKIKVLVQLKPVYYDPEHEILKFKTPEEETLINFKACYKYTKKYDMSYLKGNVNFGSIKIMTNFIYWLIHQSKVDNRIAEICEGKNGIHNVEYTTYKNMLAEYTQFLESRWKMKNYEIPYEYREKCAPDFGFMYEPESELEAVPIKAKKWHCAYCKIWLKSASKKAHKKSGKHTCATFSSMKRLMANEKSMQKLIDEENGIF